MDRIEKLRLSADKEYGYCFRQGLFARFYEQSLYWFSHAVKPLKPMLERVKGGEPVVYGGLPIASFEALVAQGALKEVETMDYGWRWPNAAQERTILTPEAFSSWRTLALTEIPQPERAAIKGTDILLELKKFDLATHTPMQAMSAIAAWQEKLRNWEGAR